MKSMLDRREFIGSASAASLLASDRLGLREPERLASRTLPPFYAEIERSTFAYFKDLVNPANGLIPDRWPTPAFASIAAVGFALTCWPIGVTRGWIERDEARKLTLATLKFFDTAPQGVDSRDVTGNRGFFYHFLDMERGLRYRDTELSSVDSALLFLGMLFAAEWWSEERPDESEIRRLGREIPDRADWQWFTNQRPVVSMGWDPTRGFIRRSWDGFNEGMMVVLLGLGAKTHPLHDGAWDAWTAPYPGFWRGSGDTRHLAFAPLFGHQYSQTWIDFRTIKDAAMRAAGLDYFENSRRATYANRAYCIANPMRWDGYGRDLWGLTACDGPGNFVLPFKGEQRTFYGYSARGPLGQPDQRDDGTLAPTAALGSLPFAPEICIPAAAALRKVPGLWGKYGFLDSFNPSFRYVDQKLEAGTINPRNGWVARDHIGIDQGPILLQAANYRNEFVWRAMRRSPMIRRGLARAGFTGGWLERDT